MTAPKLLLILSVTLTPRSDRIIAIAKKANSGIWKITKLQAVEIANKYNFYVPNSKAPTKHLGSTGILLWVRNDGEYFLFKPNEARRNMEKLNKKLKKTENKQIKMLKKYKDQQNRYKELLEEASEI